VVLDSTIFAPNTSTKTPPKDGENQDKTNGFASPKHKKVIEIEGVTDVLTKYRSRLREKNIFQNTITKSSLNSGDAQLLQQAKKTLEKINDPNADSPIDAELETVLNYIAHRGLKIYVSFFDPMVSSEIKVDDTALLMKALKSKSIPIEIFQSLEVGEVLDTVLLRHKISPKDLIIFSNQKHILTQSKLKNVTTCRYGYVCFQKLYNSCHEFVHLIKYQLSCVFLLHCTAMSTKMILVKRFLIAPHMLLKMVMASRAL
jgi:hypothetical protein